MKLLQLPHKVCGMTCMVNGLEDIYEWRTGNRLPNWLLFFVSGLGTGFVYLKNKNVLMSRMVFWGVTTKQQYKILGDIIGFTWHAIEGRSFSYALKRAKAYIDQGTPIILGALDMYHLPYYDKFYHKFHVPIHYALMVGYDDERSAILVHDCDRAEPQAISYDDLQQAWNVNVPGLSSKNTLFAFELDNHIAGIPTIAHDGLRRRATSMLEAPASMLGIRGMRRLARELPHWPDELDQKQLDASLCHMVEYTGFPPALPNRLTSYDAPGHHTAGRDGLAKLLVMLAKDYDWPAWATAADLFKKSGQAVEQLTDVIVDYLLGENGSLEYAASLIEHIADQEEQAYRLLIDGENNG